MYLPMLTQPTIPLFKFFFISFLLFELNGDTTEAQDSRKIIGAIIDVNSRVGKEQITSMEIAVHTFNSETSNKQNLVLHVIDSGGKPLQASTAAIELTKGKQVQAIVGMETWPEAALVAEATSNAQVPVLSFATSSITPVRWPFLVRMASKDSLQMQCIASIVESYGWRRVIAIYQDNGYSTDSGLLTLLSDELQAVGTEIEHRLLFPSFSSLHDPKDFIQEELEKLKGQQSRVYIIVGLSVELATYLLTEARESGLMGKDSVWIATDSVTNLLDTVNSSVLSSMEGIIGIKTHYFGTGPSFKSFSTKFRNHFRSIYPEEVKSEPGIHALVAFDTIQTIALALEKSANQNSSTSKSLLENILSSNFNGLSGEIRFKDRALSRSTTYEIVNVVGKSYIELRFWSGEYGFYNVKDNIEEKKRSCGKLQVLGRKVHWPGELDRVPLGWVMPSNAKPMVIGVPGRTSFEKFVKVVHGEDPKGYCIDVFHKALEHLKYDLRPYVLKPFYGTYDELVDQVYRKKFDAVVGDITILANRSKYVEFTQPYAESGLTMLVPVKAEEKAWLFVKPFNGTLWIVVSIVFLYTMFVVWFLEHRSNPDFRGPWKNQLSTAMWFTFSTLFFAHRETLRSNFTRVVMFIWLFTVFVVTSSYTASLTSMLTVQRLEPTITDIETLRRSNSPVGCDGDSFIWKYMDEVLHFNPNNIKNVSSQYDYPDLFKNGTIKAAFLELPYERVFLSRNSKAYQDTGLKHRFGGLGFVFPKGSPMAADFSEAFLKLSEDGTLNRLDEYWFKSSTTSDSENSTDNQPLSLSNFWGLFLVTGLTSTAMLVLYIVQLYTKFRHHSVSPVVEDDNVWIGIKKLGTYYDNRQFHQSNSDPVSIQARDTVRMISSNRECSTEYNTPGHPEPTPAASVQMAEIYIGDRDNQTRPLRLANSFPGWDRRAHRFNYVEPEWQHISNQT